ncbi:hypothetical protein AYI68_g476 [Smittium mucronatum]|uniref:Uncharacterized protein n=1 Tax=Smittium mucronatum TaxID=133383 RepID=A0A1R0H8B2_9FUNG|nr:hypothetical protein AYI68_g476 [Smittium mucronatum]
MEQITVKKITGGLEQELSESTNNEYKITLINISPANLNNWPNSSPSSGNSVDIYSVISTSLSVTAFIQETTSGANT